MKPATIICALGLVATPMLFGGSAARGIPLSQGKQPITISNASKVKQSALLVGHQQPVFGIAFSPDGKLLASAGIDKTVRLWDVGAAKQTAQLQGHTAQAVSVGFTPDGATLLSAGYDMTVRLWDVKTAAQIEVQVGDANAGTAGPQRLFESDRNR